MFQVSCKAQYAFVWKLLHWPLELDTCRSERLPEALQYLEITSPKVIIWTMNWFIKYESPDTPMYVWSCSALCRNRSSLARRAKAWKPPWQKWTKRHDYDKECEYTGHNKKLCLKFRIPKTLPSNPLVSVHCIFWKLSQSSKNYNNNILVIIA